MKRRPIVVSMCVFLMTDAVEPLFLRFLATCMSLEKHLFESFARLKKNGLFVFLLLSSLCILDARA